MTVSTDRLVTGLLAKLFADPAGTRLLREALRLLAGGEPVTTGRLAATTGRAEADVREHLAGWADTEYDDAGRVVGYGLTLRPTPHRFTVAGHTLYTWCALDTLFFPTVLGATARIESPCHATGRPVRLTVDPTDGVGDLDPATAVVSVAICDNCGSTRAAFCDHVHFFADRTAADGWLADHPGGMVLPVADAHRLARPMATALEASEDSRAT